MEQRFLAMMEMGWLQEYGVYKDKQEVAITGHTKLANFSSEQYLAAETQGEEWK